MSDELFETAKKAPPYDPALITRVARRLESRPAPASRVNVLALAVAAAAIAVVLLRDQEAPKAPLFEPDVHAPAPVRQVKLSQKTETPAPTPPKKRGTSKRPVVVPPAPAPIVPLAVKPEAKSPIEAPTLESPKGDVPVRVGEYRPRAIHEFVEVDWHRLEKEQLSLAVQRIVARRDPNALVAALDTLDSAERRKVELALRH